MGPFVLGFSVAPEQDRRTAHDPKADPPYSSFIFPFLDTKQSRLMLRPNMRGGPAYVRQRNSLGPGGYSRAILSMCAGTREVIGTDRDPTAIAGGLRNVSKNGRAAGDRWWWDTGRFSQPCGGLRGRGPRRGRRHRMDVGRLRHEVDQGRGADFLPPRRPRSNSTCGWARTGDRGLMW